MTDEQGILTAILEADRESARQYKAMIDDQIDVGGGKNERPLQSREFRDRSRSPVSREGSG